MRIALLTPTYGPDLQRLKLLRLSLEMMGCQLPHHIVVQSEDYALFRRERWDRAVELIPSGDIVPAAVEAARLRLVRKSLPRRKLERSLNKRLGWFGDAVCDGWHAQQYVKLAANQLPADVIVSLDSDVLACAPVEQTLFANGEVVPLVVARSEKAWMPHWNRAARTLLDLPAEVGGCCNFVNHPFVFRADLLRALHGWLEARYQMPWWQVLMRLRAGQLSEFTLYGFFGLEIAKMKGLTEVREIGSARWIYTERDRAHTEAIINECFDGLKTQWLVLQASRHFPVEPYRELLERRLTEARP